MKKIDISLTDLAVREMIERGFAPAFSQESLNELALCTAPASASKHARDMRSSLWVSIDNVDSRDLDQLTWAEHKEEGDKIYIAIADVDGLVRMGSALDAHAAKNTTSIYTPTKAFPMLPEKLSTDLTSLKEGSDRSALVIELSVSLEGEFILSDVYLALVRNQAKLDYEEVANWLEREIKPARPMAILTQLKLQNAIALRIQSYRDRQGALYFETKEVETVFAEGRAVGLREKSVNTAHHLIENFMIAANVAATSYLEKYQLPVIKRVVRSPKRWERIQSIAKERGTRLPDLLDVKALRNFLFRVQQQDPENYPHLSLAIIQLIGKGEYVLGVPGEKSPGHFDLALRDYAHATAPNRRFPDLVMQRLLKSHINHSRVPYSIAQLERIAAHCTQKENDAMKLQRRMHKSAAAMVLQPRIGEVFKAMVTGASEKGTWVRLDAPPIEGKLIQGFQGIDVGDHLMVKLIEVDVVKGYIDFARV